MNAGLSWKTLRWALLLLIAAAPGRGIAQNQSQNSYTLQPDAVDGDFAVRFSVTAARPWGKEDQLRVAVNYQDPANYYYIKFSAWGVAAVKVRNGVHRRIGSPDTRPLDGFKGSLLVTIQRHGWALRVIANDRVVVVTHDDEWHGGKVGTKILGDNVSTDDLRIQPLGSILVTDDFTRAADETGNWDAVAGKWINTGVEGMSEDYRMSANPFSIRAEANPLALNVTGYWFWESYQVNAAVHPQAEGAVGIAGYFQDAKNYILFRWTSASLRADGRHELIEVRNGEQKVLASAPGGYALNQWYQLGLQLCEDRVYALIDGRRVLEADTDAFGQGKVALYAEQCKSASFDDLRVESWTEFRDDFHREDEGTWVLKDTGWKHQGTALVAEKSGALALAGPKDWNNIRITTRIAGDKTAAAGLVFDASGDNNYYVYRQTADGSGVVHVHDDKEDVIAQSSRRFPSKPFTLTVDQRGPLFEAYIDNDCTLAGATPGVANGRVGVYAAAPKVQARLMQVNFLRDPPPAFISERFANDKLMMMWSSPEGSWSTGEGARWYRGLLFGNFRVEFTAAALGKAARAEWLLAGMNSDTPVYRVEFTSSPSLGVKIYRGAEVVADSSPSGSDPSDKADNLAIWRLDDAIAVLADNKVLAWTPAPDVNTVHRVGIGAGRLVMIDSARVTAADAVDETFAAAPTQWRSERGVWEITARWPCKKEWSWFGGCNDEVPILWSKQSFDGDQELEYFANVRMDLPDAPGYAHPGDINATLCGDGVNLDSGYSFIFAGWGNRRTAILKGDKIVAETDKVVLIQPQNHNFAFHRHWFRVRCEKVGNHVRMFVDDELVLSYDDPNPLTGGHAALWTIRNGLLVARAQLWYEKDGGIAPAPRIEVANAVTSQTMPHRGSEGIDAGFENDAGEFSSGDSVNPSVLSLDDSTAASGRRSLRITNGIGGGPYLVWCTAAPFDAARFGKLSFAYRVPPTVRVNLYLLVGDQYYVLCFTGSPDVVEPGVKFLGTLPGVTADDKWHTVQVNLKALLQAQLPGVTDLTVQKMALASPDDFYLRAGFGGNPFGVHYNLDDFRITP